LINTEDKPVEEEEKILAFNQFADIARKDAGGILVDGKSSGIMYAYAKCCNPIPGDPVIGYITIGEGVKIHRKTCNNLINLSKIDADKLVSVQWPGTDGTLFVAGLSLKGEDSPGILNDIAHTIVTYKDTNIKSININTNDSTFEGSVVVYVNNLEHLNNLIDRLKKLRGLYKVERFEGS
jgi:guanosine-3',5'-bis(diphosphate) 3'-pyrophosphohydrolase